MPSMKRMKRTSSQLDRMRPTAVHLEPCTGGEDHAGKTEDEKTVTSSLHEISKRNRGGGGQSNACTSIPRPHPFVQQASEQIFLMTKLTVLPRHKILLHGNSENQTQNKWHGKRRL
jgi:hypothetical protein